MATMLMDEGDVQGARRNLIQAIDLTGDRAIAQRARYELGAVYERAADAHFYLGEIYSQQGDSERALAGWRAARELDPNHRRAIERLR